MALATLSCGFLFTSSRAFAQAECAATEIFELAPEFVEPNHVYGRSVAAEEDWGFVGSSGFVGPELSGVVYVFRRQGGAWIEVDTLLPNCHSQGCSFGLSTEVQGERLVVAAPEDDIDGHVNAGSVHVFELEGNSWVESAVLVAGDPGDWDSLGRRLALDGDTIVAGALVADDGLGAAYVFGYDGANWVQEAKLVAPVRVPDSQFGAEVALRDDVIVVGAPRDGWGDGPYDSGGAYVFRYDGGTWVFEARLDSDAPLRHSDYFGGNAVLADASTLYVAADDLDERGSVFQFTYEADTWTQTAHIPNPTTEEFGRFGNALAVEGSWLAVSDRDAPYAQGDAAGVVFVYEIVGASSFDLKTQLEWSAAEGELPLGDEIAFSGDAVLAATQQEDFGSRQSRVLAFHGIADCDSSGGIDICEVQSASSEDTNGDGIPDVCQCLADLDESGAVDFGDILAVLAAWGNAGGPEDLDGSGTVGFGDVLVVLASWGPCT
jgi:hypothetical protein